MLESGGLGVGGRSTGGSYTECESTKSKGNYENYSNFWMFGATLKNMKADHRAAKASLPVAAVR